MIMSRNVAIQATPEQGRRPYARQQSVFAALAASVYAGVSPAARALLGSKWRADLRRWKSSPDSAPPLARTLEQVEVITKAGDAGYADMVCAAVRSAATGEGGPRGPSSALPLRAALIDTQRADLEEDIRENEAAASNFTDPRAMLALADSKSRTALAELRASAAIRQAFGR